MTDAERAASEQAGKTRAYGLTHGQMEQIHEEQTHAVGDKVPANNSVPDQIKDPVFKQLYSNYEIPWHEEMHYHVALETRLWDTAGAEPRRLSSAQVQVIEPAMYKQIMEMKPANGFNGYITHILHDPTRVVKKTAAPAKVAPVGPAIPADLAHLIDNKLAKTFYAELTGNQAARSWTREKTIQEIVKFQQANPK